MSGRDGGTVGNGTALGDPLRPAARGDSSTGGGEAKILLILDLDEDCLASTRHMILRVAREQGLAGDRLGDFVVAAYECVVNAVEHGGGRGRLTLSRDGGDLVCAVEDTGPGIPLPVLRRKDLPPAGSLGGRGIWLMRRLADDALFTTGPCGTVVRLRMRLPAGPAVPLPRRTPEDLTRQ
ncbi:ATP-binding protein [Nonomuraea zeae]|uniref:ATP-binding protein n=1 Tax=Nonomuraea zeae TaxID=1642303 RepID=A0A5S4GSD1_9ACTN|nr:ATP-binding protein [Nonomuraea zeae]TMR35807.1 ATP-binding protein [Nonomuraea zeae]